MSTPMNNLLELKGQFKYAPNKSKFGGKNIPKGKRVSSEKLNRLAEELQSVLSFWQKETLIGGALVSVYYSRLIPKSKRISHLLKDGEITPNQSVCGSKFGKKDNQIIHIFTHFISTVSIKNTIDALRRAAIILKTDYGNEISHNQINNLTKSSYGSTLLSKTAFVDIIVDSFYVDAFGIEKMIEEVEESVIVTIYKTNKKSDDLLKAVGILPSTVSKFDETTFLLDAAQMNRLVSKAPYLIAMQTIDMSEITTLADDQPTLPSYQIPPPQDEPVVGVIDTIFCENVPFHSWVDYHCRVSADIPITPIDSVHGTAVSSIIVDGPALNATLDDGCGRFRVRHFGVCAGRRFSSFTIMREIRDIVASNPDIKVWNLSLGSNKETSINFISPEGAMLDRLQVQYDVIFIVAGTNKPCHVDIDEEMRIGAPADSLNSIVVNSVDSYHQPASYSRCGPVLAFFNKPDISYYGGTNNEPISVCTHSICNEKQGTSFAAPWITRKVAYLIYKMGLSREAAKALIIDSAAGWSSETTVSKEIGYGVVPVHIDNVLKSRDNEIKFIMQSDSDEYETYTYQIPVPYENGKYPFIARATLCYFPRCSRQQGVDYTNTEIDLYVGRAKERKDGNIVIVPIDKNKQSETTTTTGVYEEEARKMYRKWDNVKRKCELQKPKFVPRTAFGESPTWGLSVKTKERLSTSRTSRLRFAVVITLKEMYNKNRFYDFVKRCQAKGWLVNEINVENRLDIHTAAEKQLEFDLDV